MNPRWLVAVAMAMALTGCGRPSQPIEQPGYDAAPPAPKAPPQETSERPDETGKLSGTEPTDFEMLDLEGHPVKLSSFKGKPIVLDFWATWCPPCRAAMPRLDELQTKLKDQNLVVIAASVDGSIDEVKQWVKDNPSGLTMLWIDPASPNLAAAQKGYDPSGIPTTIYISPEWKIVERAVGLHEQAEYFESAARIGAKLPES